MSVMELQSARENLRFRPLHIHQQEEYHTILLLVVHLINLLCAIPKDEHRTFLFKKAVHKLNKFRICSLTGQSTLHLAIDKKTSNVVDEFYSTFPRLRVVEVGNMLKCRPKFSCLVSVHSENQRVQKNLQFLVHSWFSHALAIGAQQLLMFVTRCLTSFFL